MYKIIITLLIYSNLLIANSFSFSELRYSDAIGKSILLNGEIEFFESGLSILYPKKDVLIEYKDDSLLYKESGEEIELNDMQVKQIIQYFDILILLHFGDASDYSDMFEVTQKDDISYLVPMGMVKNYIKKIEMLKENKKLNYVKLFLQNNDYITITIND